MWIWSRRGLQAAKCRNYSAERRELSAGWLSEGGMCRKLSGVCGKTLRSHVAQRLQLLAQLLRHHLRTAAAAQAGEALVEEAHQLGDPGFLGRGQVGGFVRIARQVVELDAADRVVARRRFRDADRVDPVRIEDQLPALIERGAQPRVAVLGEGRLA